MIRDAGSARCRGHLSGRDQLPWGRLIASRCCCTRGQSPGADPDLTQDEIRLPAPVALSALAARRGIGGRAVHRLRSSRRADTSDCVRRCGSVPSFALMNCCHWSTVVRKDGRRIFTISHVHIYIRSGSISAYPWTMRFRAPMTWLHRTSGTSGAGSEDLLAQLSRSIASDLNGDLQVLKINPCCHPLNPRNTVGRVLQRLEFPKSPGPLKPPSRHRLRHASPAAGQRTA